MAILIKAKMPKDCLQCPMETDYGTCGALPTDDDTHCEGRLPNCPLVEIPDVYIDISKAFMTELCNNVCTDTPVAPLHLPHEEVKDDGTD